MKPDVDASALDRFLYRVFNRSVQYERVPCGVSTQVYRLHHRDRTLYLRVAEKEADGMWPEAAVHEKLRELGVSVPYVVHYEPFDEALRRSILVVSEIPGAPIIGQFDAAALRAAGRDLAIVNGLDIDGYGWVRRDAESWPLAGEYEDYYDFVHSELESWTKTLSDVLTPTRLDRLGSHIAEAASAPAPDRGSLVHGDLDGSHIFVRDGVYTGLIDFGELRGAERWYDLAHFLLHSDELGVPGAADVLCDGYAERAALPDDFDAVRHRAAILIGTRQLLRWLRRWGPAAVDNPVVAARCRRLAELLG